MSCDPDSDAETELLIERAVSALTAEFTQRQLPHALALRNPRSGSWTAPGVRPGGCPARHNEAE
jgi:hypothetical protein